jgi:predicted TIM-barrel fold metal-dependent hydrolase
LARDGFRIFDADTHVGPSMDILEAYLSVADREALEPLSRYRRQRNDDIGGRVTYIIGQRQYHRRLGETDARPPEERPSAGFQFNATSRPSYKGQRPVATVDHDPAARIGDMDQEGVDVDLLLPSGWFGSFTTAEVERRLELAMNVAYNRWMADYCSTYPERLTGVIMVPGRDVEGGLAEIRRCGHESWVMGLYCWAPHGMPLDHPDLEPYWAAAQEYDLAVVLHTNTWMPPYAPGGLDTWDNAFLQRAAAHSWCGQRNMADLIAAGLFDRYPELRIATLEAGHGWLPFWAKRLDEHAEHYAGSLPPLKQTPSEYITSGRYFQSIELSEGEALTSSVIDLIGDGVLVYATDYPHAESWFPHSVDTIMSWSLSEDVRRKLLWDNALRLYHRYQPRVPETAGVARVE